MATNNAYFQAVTLEHSLTEKKNALKKAFGAWTKAKTSTLDVYRFAVTGNAEKPMAYLQNLAHQCGLWPSVLKGGETVGAGYSTVLRDISLCRKKNATSEYSAFEEFAQFLSAVYKAGQLVAKKEKDIEEGKRFAEAEKLAKENSPVVSEENAPAEEKPAVQLVKTVSATETASFYLQSVLDNDDMPIGEIRQLIARALTLINA